MPKAHDWNNLTRHITQPNSSGTSTTQQTPLVINQDTLDGGLSKFLDEFLWLQDKQLEINSPTSEEFDDGSLNITGTTTFFGLANIPLTLNLQRHGSRISATATFTVISKNNANWAASNAFPQLPQQYDSKQKKFISNIIESIRWQALSITLQNYNSEATEKGITLEGSAYLKTLTGQLSCLVATTKQGSESNPLIKCTGKIVLNNPNQTQPRAPSASQIKNATAPWQLSTPIAGVYLSAEVSLNNLIPGLTLQSGAIQLYTPLKEDWESIHPLFSPICAIAVQALVSKHSIPIATQLVYEPTGNNLTLNYKGQQLSLKSLADLGDLTANSNPLEDLPVSLEALFEPLTEISVVDFTLAVNMDNGTPHITQVRLKLGLENLHWTLWKDKLEVSELECAIEILQPGANTQINMQLWGELDLAGLPLFMSAKKVDGDFILTAGLSQKQTLPLASFAAHYFPHMHVPADLTIDTLQLVWDSAQGFTFSGSLAEKPEQWAIYIGKQKLIFEDLHFSFGVYQSSQSQHIDTQSPDFIGGFSGAIQIGDFKLAGNYSLPGNFEVKADIKKLQLSVILDHLSPNNKAIPQGFDFTLEDTQVIIAEQAGKTSFKALTTLPNVGTMALQIAESAQGSTGVLMAIDAPSVHPANLPGFNFLKPLEKVITLSDCLLVISSIDNASLNLPDNSSWQNGVTNTRAVQRFKQNNVVKQGINFSCKWHIDTRQKPQKFLQELLGLNPTLDSIITIDTSHPHNIITTFFVELETHFAGNPFDGALGIRLAAENPEFFIAGRTELSIGKRNYTSELDASLTPEGIELEGSLLGTLNLHGLAISDLAILGTIDWAGIPGMGFSGELDVGKASLALTMLLDSAAGSVVLAGAISRLTVHDIVYGLAKSAKLRNSVNQLLGHIAIKGTQQHRAKLSEITTLHNRDFDGIRSLMGSLGFTLSTNNHDLLLVERIKNKAWTLADRSDNMKHYSITRKGNALIITVEAQVYICPVASHIGDLRFEQGFYLNAALQISHFEAEATINIQPARGFAIDATANKPLIVANKNFLRLSDASGKVGPQLSVTTYKQPQHNNPLLVNPHIYVSGALYSMGMEVAEAYAMIGSKGVTIHGECHNQERIKLGDISGHIKAGWILNIDVTSLSNMSASYSSKLALDLVLKIIDGGKVAIKDNIKGVISLSYRKGQAKASFKAKCVIVGNHLNLHFTIKTNGKDLSKIEHIIARHIARELGKIYKGAEKFVEDVGKGIVKGFEDDAKLAKTLSKGFKQDTQKVIKAFDKLGKSEQQLGKALKQGLKLNPKTAAKELKTLNKSADQMAKVLKHGFNADTKEIGEALHSVNLNQKAISHALSAAGAPQKEIKHFCDSTFKGVKKDAKKVKKALKHIFK